MDTGKGVAGWSVFMGMVSAGVTFLLTDGNMKWVLLAFVFAVAITAILGPTFVTFLDD